MTFSASATTAGPMPSPAITPIRCATRTPRTRKTARWAVRTAQTRVGSALHDDDDLAETHRSDSSIGVMSDTRELSRETFERLNAELEQLTTEGRIDIAQKIEAARALGDLSENGDYHAAKDQQGKMEARIRQIKGILQDVAIVEAQSDGKVGVQSVVAIEFAPGEEPERYLVGHIAEQRDGVDVLSPESPLGSQLLGKKAGESATYEVNGRQLTVKVVSVE